MSERIQKREVIEYYLFNVNTARDRKRKRHVKEREKETQKKGKGKKEKEKKSERDRHAHAYLASPHGLLPVTETRELFVLLPSGPQFRAVIKKNPKQQESIYPRSCRNWMFN